MSEPGPGPKPPAPVAPSLEGSAQSGARLSLLRAVVGRLANAHQAPPTAAEAAAACSESLSQWSRRRALGRLVECHRLRDAETTKRPRDETTAEESNQPQNHWLHRPRKRHRGTPFSATATTRRTTVNPATAPLVPWSPSLAILPASSAAAGDPILLRSLHSPIPAERWWASQLWLAFLQADPDTTKKSEASAASDEPPEASRACRNDDYYAVLLKDHLLDQLLLPLRSGPRFPLEAAALLVRVPSHCFHRRDFNRLVTALADHATSRRSRGGSASGSSLPTPNPWTATAVALAQLVAHLVLAARDEREKALAQHRLQKWLWAPPNLDLARFDSNWSPLAALLAAAHAGLWPRPSQTSSAGAPSSAPSSSSFSSSSRTAALHHQPPRWDPHASHPPPAGGPHGTVGRLLHPQSAAQIYGPPQARAPVPADGPVAAGGNNVTGNGGGSSRPAGVGRLRRRPLSQCRIIPSERCGEEEEEKTEGGVWVHREDDDEVVDDEQEVEDDDEDDGPDDDDDDVDPDDDDDLDADDHHPAEEDDGRHNEEEPLDLEPLYLDGGGDDDGDDDGDDPSQRRSPKQAPAADSAAPSASATATTTTATATANSPSLNSPRPGEEASARVSQDDSTGQHRQEGYGDDNEEHEHTGDEDLCNEDDDDMDEDDEDDDEEEENEEDDDEDDEDGAVEIELADLEEAAVAEVRHMAAAAVAQAASDAAEEAAAAASSAESSSSTVRVPPAVVLDRKRMLLQASMQVLCALYPHMHHQHHKSRRDWLDLPGEMQLVEGMNLLIQPPKKLPASKIILRRAPTQEEFFRGSLSRNPITIASLTKGDVEPTVADLRLYIATELGMADSAELLEILVAGKILDVSLKLRVVHQVLWRNHLLDSPSSQQSHHPFLASSTASGLSMIISSTITERLSSRSGAITADTPLSALPAMVATYRLAGVDGEATEDTITALVDPEESQDHEFWDWTKDVVAGRGIFVLLRSIQNSLADTIRKIRRDAVGCAAVNQRNWARERFRASTPPPALILLQHCCQLQCNRKRLLQARAPTVLLTCLLDTLKVLGNESDQAKSNPTAEVLQQLIEKLTSDISEDAPTPFSAIGTAVVYAEDAYESDSAEDAASMPLLLEALETIELSPPLRLLIAKLLPFLTYGQADLSRTLAEHFSRNIKIELLGQYESSPDQHLLMNTFVQTAISLPANAVCNSLRFALIPLVDRLEKFIAKDQPKQPPPACAAFWNKGKKPLKRLDSQWRSYLDRDGLKTAFRVLVGLCQQYAPTQCRLGNADWLRGVHWIEATSESVGSLAEELLDTLSTDKTVSETIDGLRKKTRQLKKELAEERRAQALQKMPGQAGRAGDVPAPVPASSTVVAAAGGVRSAAASILAPVFGLFSSSDTSSANIASEVAVAKSGSDAKARAAPSDSKPSWMAEMEAMEDEEGLICSVCQEGRTLQPEELLGLYAYVKKVALQEPVTRSGIEGVTLLKALPHSLPSGLMGDPVAEEWFLMGRSAAENVPTDASASSLSRKNAVFVTTVSAGNAIHLSCHRKARQADRSHPKAPKSEWEGAVLRNSRVNCNVILPLVSCRSSRVPLIAVDCAMTEHQATISNLIGSTPKSMLWTVLHDLRLLLLRMAYGEPLNADCGGGSLASNCQLVFYQLLAADMFDKDAQVDQPQQSSHARGLPAGFLAACAMGDVSPALTRGIADAAPMAALNCVAFGSAESATRASGCSAAAAASVGDCPASTTSKIQWKAGQPYFFRGLVICAGRRHALGLEGSGCQRATASGSSRAVPAGNRSTSSNRSGDQRRGDDDGITVHPKAPRSPSVKSRRNSSAKASIEDFASALRPFLTYSTMIDQLSSSFSVSMEDVQVELAAQQLAETIESCRAARTIAELLQRCRLPSPVDPDELMDWLQKGMMAA